MAMLRNDLQAIRPCRESRTGWTPPAERLLGNRNSLVLNERGPALKVFWSRLARDGRRAGEHVLAKAGARDNRTVDQENRAGGSRAGFVLSTPFGSKGGKPEHRLTKR